MVGEEKKSDDYTQKVWVNAEQVAEVTAESIATINYGKGYVLDKIVNAETGEEVKAEDKVKDNTVINIIYKGKTVTIRYEYRYPEGRDYSRAMPALPEPFQVTYGETFDVIDLPKVRGYRFSAWEMEVDKDEESQNGPLQAIINVAGQILDFVTGTIKADAAGTQFVGPDNDAVVYTVVTRVPTPTPDDPTPGDPTPIDDDPTPTAATPAGTVLGARREDAAASDGAAVLGARRGRTEDDTNSTARVFAILVSAAAALSLMLTGRKKEEEEQ